MDDRTTPSQLAADVPRLLAHEARTRRLIYAANVQPPQVTQDARRDVVAFVTASVHDMPDVCRQLLAAWLDGHGHATARTWRLAEELLLVAATLAARPHRAAGEPLATFPALRIPHAVAGDSTCVAADLVTATVRGEADLAHLTLAAYLAPDTDPVETARLMRALVEVTAGCVVAEARERQQPLEDVLAKLGIAAL